VRSTLVARAPEAGSRSPQERPRVAAPANVLGHPAGPRPDFSRVRVHSGPVLQRQPVDAGPAPAPAAAPAPAPAFPARGVRVIGPDAGQLVSILASCTGLLLHRNADQVLTIGIGPAVAGRNYSEAARGELARIIASPAGIVVDTDPAGPGVEIGAFSEAHPGYQQVDIPNIRALSGATGAGGGVTDCDALLHEMAEAESARRAATGAKAGPSPAFSPAHAAGTAVEESIRRELHLPLRPTGGGGGDTQQLGTEAGGTLLFLSSLTFGTGKNVRTQISLTRCRLVVTGPQEATCDNEVLGSTVLAGSVRFRTPDQARAVFNRNAAALGFAPIEAPPPARTSGGGP
jgi:hypothetical protein